MSRHRLDPAHRPRRPTRQTVAVAALLATAGLGCLVAAHLTESSPASASTPPSAVPSTEVTPGPATISASPVLRPRHSARSVQPVGVVIGRLGVDAVVTPLGLQADGTVQVPSDPDQAGWWDQGPTPGARGSAVLLGHVDSTQGPAVFAGLSTLHHGDTVRVTLRDHRVRTFSVRYVRTYLNADFPARRVYGPSPRRDLTIITCGGAYDAALGGYQANVVVYARRSPQPA